MTNNIIMNDNNIKFFLFYFMNKKVFLLEIIYSHAVRSMQVTYHLYHIETVE